MANGYSFTYVAKLSEPVLSIRVRKHVVQVALEQRAGVLEVLFGVGFGGGDGLEGFVEDGDDALLFGERARKSDLDIFLAFPC